MGKRTIMLPPESVLKLVSHSEVGERRKLMTLAFFYTGLRPGELHGLRFRDLIVESGVKHFHVAEQWLLARAKEMPAQYGPLKTRWCERGVPVHPFLWARLQPWLDSGWASFVGREPRPEDPLFPDAEGFPFREERSAPFVADLVTAGCPTTFRGLKLTPYAIRHTFATMIKRFQIDPDVRDPLMGHRPKNTRGMNYDVDELPLLAAELNKIPDLIAANFPDLSSAGTGGGGPGLAKAATPSDLVPALVPAAEAVNAPLQVFPMILAEEKGFEPLVPLRERRFSKPLP